MRNAVNAIKHALGTKERLNRALTTINGTPARFRGAPMRGRGDNAALLGTGL